MTNYCWWTGTLSDRYSLASVLIWSEDMIKVCLHLYLALLPKAWQPQDMDISHLFCKMQLIIVPNGGGGGVWKEVSWSQCWETAPICIRIRAFKHSYIINLKKLKKIKCFAISSLKNTFFTMRKYWHKVAEYESSLDPDPQQWMECCPAHFLVWMLLILLCCLDQSQKLLSHMAEVYVSTSGDVKRTILRIIEVLLLNS